MMMRPRKSWDRLYFSEFYAYKITKDLRTSLRNILFLGRVLYSGLSFTVLPTVSLKAMIL